MFRSAEVKLILLYSSLISLFSLIFSTMIYKFAIYEFSEGLQYQFQELYKKGLQYDTSISDSLNHLNLKAQNHHLFIDLIYFNIFIIVMSLLFSFILAKYTLKPINKSHQAQIRFAAQAGHELRTPLAAMRADTEATLIRLKNETKFKQNYSSLMSKVLRHNLEDISRLELLTNHLIDLARANGNINNLKKEKVDLSQVADQAVNIYLKQHRQLKNKIYLDLNKCCIISDTNSMLQLFTILIDNAYKYSEPNNINIHISTYSLKRKAIIKVSDNGIGIQTKDLNNIFKEFYQLNPRSDVSNKINKTKGYGLGLSIVKKIVVNIKGSIKVDSQYGKGTTFIIKMPLCR